MIYKSLCSIICLAWVSCSSSTQQLTSMPAPVGFTPEKKSLLQKQDLLGKSPYKGILYATDRSSSKNLEKHQFYSGTRGSVITVGVGELSFTSEKRQRTLLNLLPFLGTRELTSKVRKINELGYLQSALPYGELTDPESLKKRTNADAAFANLVNKKLQASSLKDITIFIHGYKNVFDNPLLVASELWSYMGHDGVFIAYAWPATPKLAAYFKDIETTGLSARNLRKFLDYLSLHTNAEKINLVAHSAGTRVLIGAMHELSLSPPSKSLRLGQVVLIASDHDPQKFASSLGHGILNLADDITVYLSGKDTALGFSHKVFGIQRLGELNKPKNLSSHVSDYLKRSKNLHFIDVSNALGAFSGNGHSYHRSSPWVSNDIIELLTKRQKPTDRLLHRKPDTIPWIFPENYAKLARTGAE